ncbi:hypothetical protein VE04_08399 [Pseudogymnoascus sp. 24MN13]|nr:hypothetical protein VE04_08399 [Pseudogymnoascus sp. 24MN13]
MASTTTESPAVTPKYPIIDSHIHIYPASEHSLEEYTAATTSPPELEGFVFLETDREHDLDAARLTAAAGRGL